MVKTMTLERYCIGNRILFIAKGLDRVHTCTLDRMVENGDQREKLDQY
jgi:hypothetical protein